ncbi:hypothetical protein DJ64_18605 [Streptomyces griseorubens]|uniref:Uncharacterized protein n=1 Tax=Streptomyces griseorubens TaxID=66897 RepID=A0ABR4SYR8_9ACTN|nr:hypothetical protein DJ64_18605 [Streptomyces griseorubens]
MHLTRRRGAPPDGTDGAVTAEDTARRVGPAGGRTGRTPRGRANRPHGRPCLTPAVRAEPCRAGRRGALRRWPPARRDGRRCRR